MSQAEADIWKVFHRHGQSEHHPDDVEHAIEALKPFGTEIIPLLSDVLEQGNDDEKLLVLQVLREIDPKPGEIVPVLISLLAEDRLISITATKLSGSTHRIIWARSEWFETV